MEKEEFGSRSLELSGEPKNQARFLIDCVCSASTTLYRVIF
jgi:hypothetical protein